MARKVDDQGQPTAPQGAVGDNDLEILQPDREIVIDGRAIVVREYRFFEGLQMHAQAKGFFEDLYAMFEQSSAAPSFDDVADLIGAHQDDVVKMVATSTGCEPEWILGLDDQDGDALMLTWWLANAGFFIRRVMRRAAAAQIAPVNRSAGLESSTTSSPLDTSRPQTTSQASQSAR